jgi:eukaryotic-like serine/threonine-protein kinase
MDRKRWNKVNEIFHAALELPVSDRDGFVSTASNGDTELEQDVIRLLKADSEAGSYLETPAIPVNPAVGFDISPIPFKPGDIIKMRFRIERHVGQGGMGHVFEAYDLDLKVRVALKVIRPEIASNPAALDYFRREVRMARTITHVNVCRTYDLDHETIAPGSPDSKELFFLTMEFLDGETLASRIKRAGSLAIADAQFVASQIASGLDSAHAAGVIHRDLKPANIMLMPGPDPTVVRRAVIMDFGLARRNPINTATSSAINSGALVGTLAYMAPEQLDPGMPVSAATDVYAFGLTLFEMVTGQRAYPATNLLSGTAQRLSDITLPTKALAPGVLDLWERAIEGCLQPEPGDRFQSAVEVIGVLEGKVTVPPRRTNQRVASGVVQSASWLRRRWRIAGAIVLACVSLFAVWLRLFHQKGNSRVTTGALVYLAPVRNQTGEKALDNLTELFQASLSQSVQINLLDQGDVGDTLQLMTKPPDTSITEPVAREIAMRTGAVRVIFPTVTGSGGSYQLRVDIQQPDNTPSRFRDHWTKDFVWHTSNLASSSSTIPQELNSAIRKASDWIRYEAGESKNDIARLDAPPDEATTTSWEALTEYEISQRFSSQGDWNAAIQALRRALVADPHFSLAYARLGDLLAIVRQSTESINAYQRALDTGMDTRLTRRERDRIKGMYAVDTGDMQSAEEAFRDYANYYENDPAGWEYRSYPLFLLGRTEEAITSLRRAAELEPHRSFPLTESIACLLVLGRIEEAKGLILRLRQEGFADFANMQEGQLEFVQRDMKAAQASIQKLQNSNSISMRSAATTLASRMDAELGDISAAMEQLKQALAEARMAKDSGNESKLLLDLAFLKAERGDTESCLDDLDEAMLLAPSVRSVLDATNVVGALRESNLKSNSARILRSLASFEKLVPSNQDGTYARLAHLRLREETLLALGDWNGALTFARRAATVDFPATTRGYLGRASFEAASHVTADSERMKLLKEALQAYAVGALHPGLIWSHPGIYPPGEYANQLIEYRRTALALKDGDSLARSNLALRALRPQESEPK